MNNSFRINQVDVGYDIIYRNEHLLRSLLQVVGNFNSLLCKFIPVQNYDFGLWFLQNFEFQGKGIRKW